MQPRKYRWSKDYESAEEELVRTLTAKNIRTDIWHGEPGEAFADDASNYDKTIWCAEGSLSVEIPVTNKTLSLQPGDALELPSGTTYTIVTGINGCVCYESQP